MSEYNPMWRRYLRLFGADPRADLDDELEFHLQERTDDLVSRGVPPERARHEAERRLGDLHTIRREVANVDGERRRRERVGDWARDLSHSLRRLRREPAFTLAAVLTLTLGIGAAAGVFAVVDGVALKPLPYPDADRLVRLSPSQNFNMAMADALGTAPALESSSGVSQWGLTLTGNGEPAQLTAQAVDAEFFQVLRAQPVLGRAFRPTERDPGLSDVVILSHAVWRTRFGADPGALGRRISLDGAGHDTRTIVGVMPEGFVPPLVGSGTVVSAWIPLSRAPGRTVATDSTWYVNGIIARMVPAATVEQTAAEIRTLTARLVREFPGRLEADRTETAGAMGLLDSMVGDVRSPLFALLGGVGLIMLLACANLANLLLARGERRRSELALRSALGAGRVRLIREQLTDSVLLALLGGAGGMLLARGLLATLDLGRAATLPRTAALAVDWRVMSFTVVLSLLAAATFGLWPALRASNANVRDDLGAGTRGTGLTRSGGRLGGMLVAGEIALATVLVTGAGLLLKSLRELSAVEVGIDPGDVVMIQLAPPGAKYDGGAARSYYDQVFERLRAIPGVRTVGAIHLLPLTLSNWGFPYLAEGQDPPDGPLPSANFRVVTPDYFRAVDQPLLEGRPFTEADRQHERLTVGMVNRTMANALWPGESAVGKTVRLFGSQPFEVVGVVSDVRQFTLDRAPEPEMYVPHGSGWSLQGMVVAVEATGDLRRVMAAAPQAVWAVDEDVPIVRIQPMDEVVGASMARRSFFARVLSFFGVLALALGSVGVFGVTAYTMGARRTEFGIRMALGATRARVLGGALGRGAVSIGVGLALGLAASVAASRVLQSLLFGVDPGDPATQLAAGIVLAVVAGAATFVPAYRATRIDAASVMRAQ